MQKIVVIDDDPGIQDIFRIILSRAGYEVTILADGRPILDRSQQVPDLYLIDKQMPRVDGLELCRFLKADPRSAHVPIVITSASFNLAKISQEAGADSCLEKPFCMKDLLTVIAKNIRK